MRPVTAFIVATTLARSSCGGACNEGNDTPLVDTSDTAYVTPTWNTDVKPILSQYCSSCHQGLFCGSHCWLESYENVTDIADAGVCGGSTVGECIPVRIHNGDMPIPSGCLPGDPGCITHAEMAVVEDWVASGMPE